MSTPIQITGNLTTDPELTYLPTGRPVARSSVAVNSRRRLLSGEWTDAGTTFFPVTVWAEQAEHVSESLIKGSRVVVLGTIKARSWTSTDGERAGQTLTRLEVTAEIVAASLQWATASITKAPRPEQAAAVDCKESSDAPSGAVPGCPVQPGQPGRTTRTCPDCGPGTWCRSSPRAALAASDAAESSQAAWCGSWCGTPELLDPDTIPRPARAKRRPG